LDVPLEDLAGDAAIVLPASSMSILLAEEMSSTHSRRGDCRERAASAPPIDAIESESRP
jgi:hypothetical protein